MSGSCEQVFEMSSLEKRQANRRGSTHGPRKFSNGISDTSSVGSFMDETDREVSSLTDRAFRSLCIGEDAIYNDLEVSSPADLHKACAQESLQNKDLRTTCCGIQYEEAEKKNEVASTFQHSFVDVAQEHILRDETLSYKSNGSMEAMWQQKRSTSRADKSALLSIERELSEFSFGYHSNFKSGPSQSYGNHFHAVGRVNTATSSKTKLKALNTTNFFFHSEFSPFQLWKDYNRFPFERVEPSGLVPATEFPRWYDSPLYKELTATHRISNAAGEGRQFTQRKFENVAASQRSRSTVIQKASAIEKRCESEMLSNCPPWKNNNFVRNKLSSNRPSTVSPSNEKVHRPDSSLLYHNRHTYEIQHKVGKVGSSEMSNRTTPFNITQLLTPVIPGRQETETSEILQFAHTPLISECDSDLKPQSDAKQLRDSYKSKASSLLFNLKDNRKRVKSTYSPTKFKGLEISDRNKQPSKLEGRESRLSEASGSKVSIQEHSTALGTWELCNSVQPNYELSLFQTAEHKQHADKSHNNINLMSQYGTTNCNIPYLGSQNNHHDHLTNREREHYELSTNSGLGNSGGSPVGHINHGTTFYRRDADAGHQNFVRNPSSGYINNQMTEENCSWKRTGPVNMVTKEMINNNVIKDELPYKGEIAALIEMDKQRKATDKQYLPSANEGYTMRKEMCINKVNENVNGSWLPKDKQIQDTKSSFQTYANKHFSNNHTNTSAISQNLYEFQHNGLQKKQSPHKEVNLTRGSEITRHEKAELCLPRHMRHATSDRETEKDYSQRTQFLQSMEEKYRYNEESDAYQPYKYESNKQWHIATTENRHNKGEECMSRQVQQSEMKVEQPGESNYIHSLSRTSCIQQQSTAYSARTSQRNLITEDRAKTEQHKPTYSIDPSQIYHKQGDMNTDLNILNTQRTWQNNNNQQTRGDRFNINDILSVRDNEQAKRVRENKHSLNGRVGDPNKLEHLTSPVTADEAEDLEGKTEPSKVQSQLQQDGNSHCKHENTNVSYGYVRNESHIANDVKERTGKDIFISNENDKITLRALSYKEKGQTKQEILTSKLKAHAQKEISAIKEKGLAKHAIPSRNPVKPSIAVSNEKGQINQEILSLKKEITAEKLNHIFQNITYSGVPLYKEQRNQGKDEPKYESLTAEKVELPTRDMGSEINKVATEKERTKIQMIKPQEEKFTEADKKNYEVQKFVKNDVHQPNMQSRENQLSKPSKDNEKERSTNDTIPAKCFSNSPTLKVFSNEESVVKKEDKTSSNLLTTSNNTKYLTFKANGNDSPKNEVLVKSATTHLTLYNISGEAIALECSVNKAKEQLSNVNIDKPTDDSNTASLKCFDLAETTKGKNNTSKEKPLILPNARQLEIDTRQDKTPTDWMKDKVTAFEVSAEFTEPKTTFPYKQMANTEQEREDLQSGDGGISENQTVLSESSPKASNQEYCKPNAEPQEKETWQAKQAMQAEAFQTSKTNEDVFFQQPQNTDFDALKTLQNTHANKELRYPTTLRLNKAVNMQLDSSEENKYSLQQEPKTKKLHFENSEVQESVSQLKLKIRHKNQNQQIIRDKEVTENNNQQQDSERAPDTKHLNQKAKDFHEHIETTPTENKQSNNDIRTYSSNGSKSPGIEHSEEKLSMPIITIDCKDQHLSSHPAPDKTADITNPVSETHVIHITSKEDSSPMDEPVIYSICVSSTAEAVSEDEPIIYSISVSGMSDASMTTGLENLEKTPNQLSIEQGEKDDKETIRNKNKESDFLESKEDSKEVKLLLNNNMAEQETVVRKYDSPISKDKLDYYGSTELDNISSSYESLLAKYGLSNGDTIHVETDQKEQDKNQGDEKEESTHNTLQKIQDNTMDTDHMPVKKMLPSADFTKKHSPGSRKPKSPEASPKRLRNVEENLEQHVTHSEQEHQTANGGGTQRAGGIVYSDRNIKQDVLAKQKILMSKVVPVCEDIVDTQLAKQIVANGNVQLKENKQVRQKVQTMETGLKENDDDVVSKSTEVVQVKCENDTQHTAGFNSANIINKSHNHSCDDSPQLSYKISTNDCQIMIKTQDTGVYSVQNSQNAVNQAHNTKSPILQYRTQEECASDTLKQVSKECLQTGDNKALQNNRKELVCKSEYPEPEQVKFMTSNEVKINRVIVSQKEISTFTNEETKESGNVNQNPIKHAFPSGKRDQRVFTGADVLLEDKEVDKNDIEIQIKADTVCTKGAVPPNNVSAQNAVSAKVTGTKVSSAPGVTEDDLERLENEKWKREPVQKEREIIKDEITTLNKEPKPASSVIKGDKDAECESSKRHTNLKEAKAQPQDKKDDHFEKLIIDKTRKNSGQKEIKAVIGAFKESSDIIRWDIEGSGTVLGDKHDQFSNVYNPQKDALLERKGNTYDGKHMYESNQNSQYHDTVLTRKEGTFTKTEVTQRERKTTRPEISALADYARLRVISAEDDTITEKDLLQKMNTSQKYNLSAVEPQKANFSMSVGGTEQNKQLSVNKKSENLNATAMPLQVPERQTYKITDEILAGHNQCSPRSEIIAYPKPGSLAKSSDDRLFAVKDTESTKEKTLTNHMQPNTKKYLTAQDYGYSRSHEVYQPQNPRATHPVQRQIESKNDSKLKQPVNANMLERKVYPQVKNSQSLPQVSIETELNSANRHADNQIKEEVKDEETTEELQYYIVNTMESETKPKNNPEPLSLSHKITSNKDFTEIHATSPRSNTSSPALGKSIMFKVKDNTGKTSSVTKTVRPRFHRSFSEEFRIGSPVDTCCGSEKDKVEHDHENDPKESASSPVLHEQSVTSHRVPRAKEIQARNKMLSPGFIAPKEPRSYNTKSHMIKENESRSLINTVSEDVERLASSSVVMTDSRGFSTEHIRHAYTRPESSCYERPESACYDRPESACSDIRAACKPPAVPPKTEKALRRAKRLTTRRVKKVEDRMTSDTPVQPETKFTRTVSSLPASPMVQMSTPQSVQASPPISHYHVEPNYAPPAPSIVAHSFPMTQRKLLQDPNSGQIFMVDMPVQVKTKTFFDPETGKYLQLNVRQKTQSTLSQPASVEVLGHPYMLYPGFLPMSISVPSLPSVRSTSQMSAPATLTEEPNQLKASHEPSDQEIFKPERHRNVQQHNGPVCKTREQTGREILHTENVRMTPRQTHIITMSELEDFAAENT